MTTGLAPTLGRRDRDRWMKLAPAISWLAIVATAGAAQAADVPTVGWGKANISYQQYHDDALECGKTGLASDIDHSAPVNTLRTASNEMDALYNQNIVLNVWRDGGTSSQGGDYNAANAEMAAREHERQQIEAAANPKQQFARIKELMFVEVRKCMSGLGYSRFALTEGQRNEMRALKGADARRQYLYKLASNPEVLDKQKYASKP